MRSTIPRTVAALALVLLLVCPGCGGDDQPAAGPDDSATATGTGGGTDKPAPPPPPSPAWQQPLEDATARLGAGELDDAENLITEAERLLADSDEPGTAEPRTRLESLKTDLASARADQRQRQRKDQAATRTRRLDDARGRLAEGKLDEATRALEEVLAQAPTSDERRLVRKLKDSIEQRRRARRRLGSWMKLLGSEDRSEVRAAQNQLRRDPESALPLLIEAVRSTDKPVLVRNTLETLRRLRRPEIAVPEIVGLLGRVDQRVNWPDAVRELGLLKDTGAGAPLLELVRSSQDPAQRAAVLDGLARVSDPPVSTLAELLPILHEDGDDLEPALRASANAIRVHGQQDIVALRGQAGELTDLQRELLSSLPGRLAKLAAATGEDIAASAVAARVLGFATGALRPAPLKDVKIAGAVAEAEDGKAAAVLDGVWNSVELPTMWRHPVGRAGSIILDLGSERTVVGVRIWNFNQPGGTHRGWKELEVFVSNSRSDLSAEVSGVIPPAPGIADAPDYSTLLPVNFVRGRYVILKARSVWRADGHAGLTEIQVLGF